MAAYQMLDGVVHVTVLPVNWGCPQKRRHGINSECGVGHQKLRRNETERSIREDLKLEHNMVKESHRLVETLIILTTTGSVTSGNRETRLPRWEQRLPRGNLGVVEALMQHAKRTTPMKRGKQ